MIHHFSIAARDPDHVAAVLAELIGGHPFNFSPFPGSRIVVAEDGHGTAIEVYPLGLELAPGEGLDIEQLAHDTSRLPDLGDKTPDEIAEAILDLFEPRSAHGGSIEAAADEDGVLVADLSFVERAAIT